MSEAVHELYVFRPTLCKELMKRGFKCELMPNIYQPEKRAWSFQMTTELCEFVIDYYKNVLNSCAPKIVFDYLEEHKI